MKRAWTLTVNVVMLIVSTLALSGFIGQYGAIPEILGHLRLLWIALLIPLVVLAICLKQRPAILCGFILLLIVTPVVQLYLPRGSQPQNSATHLRLLELNLWGGKNRNFDAVSAEIAREDPDILGLSEITQQWADHLQPVVRQYKYQIVYPHLGGIALYSKYPMTGAVNNFGKMKRPRIDAQITVNGEKVAFVFAHPVIPLKSLAPLRNGELALLAQEARDNCSKGPCILAGDLNCTPWSYYFERLLADGNLVDSERGFGPQPSWNTFIHAVIMPIDHCLISNDIVCLSRKTGPFVGSDHLPVIIDLGIPGKS
ncbi:MAG TPA: endonuclease/exonuclease/phosphatase family protein [Planktothrix sp.]|jgi:endonuclease/exonuclease/phosphatase (EEP) superfamily protein YafD